MLFFAKNKSFDLTTEKDFHLGLISYINPHRVILKDKNIYLQLKNYESYSRS